MQGRAFEVFLALVVLAATALSVRQAAVAQVRRSEAELAAAALESLVSARVSAGAATGYRNTGAGDDRYREIEQAFVALGASYLRDGRVPDAIAVFEMTVQAVPQSSNAWLGLGAAYESAGDRKRAVTSYAQSVALNPDNEDGRLALKRLQGT
jgi:Tfp pilus assembly protein PilF